MPDQAPPDEKTLEAIRKIRKILIEHDLLGFLSIISPTRAHWVYALDASWSCISIDDDTGQARFRAKRADFKTAEQHQRVVELTSHAIFSARDLAAQQFAAMKTICDLLESNLDIEHFPRQDIRHDK